MTNHSNAGMAHIKVGGHVYPVVSAHRCRVCRSRHRRLIEQQMVGGRPPGAIAFTSWPRAAHAPFGDAGDHTGGGSQTSAMPPQGSSVGVWSQSVLGSARISGNWPSMSRCASRGHRRSGASGHRSRRL